MQLLDIILSSCAVIGISFAVALIVKNGFKSAFISIFLYAMAFDCIHMTLNGVPMYNFFWLKFTLLSFNTVLGLLLFMHSNILVNKKFKFSILFVVTLIAYLLLFSLLLIKKVDIANDTYQFSKPVINILFSILAIYILNSKKDTTNIDRKKTSLATEQNIIFCALCLVEFSISVVNLTLKSSEIYYILVYSLVLITVIYIGYSELFTTTPRYDLLGILSGNRTRDKDIDHALSIKVELSDERITEIVDKIELFTNENLGFHRDPDFKISNLSTAIGENTKYISFVLNSQMQSNFNGYINSLRVEEAITILQNKMSDDLTIEFIGEQIGFRTRSSFYAAFKASTGTTPLRYKQSYS